MKGFGIAKHRLESNLPLSYTDRMFLLDLMNATQEKQGWVKFPENKPAVDSTPLWLFDNGKTQELNFDGYGYHGATHFLVLPQKPEV